jgi:16S rRNA G966 N2-methylase RsmD
MDIINAVIPIEKIKPHPQNYNQHPDSQIAQLEASYEEFGQFNSIIVWQRPGGEYIQVAREGFLTGAKNKGATAIRADILPEDTDPMVIKRIMLADNLHAQNSIADDEALARLLQEQRDAGYALSSLGSDDETLRQMLEAMGDGYETGDEERDETEDELPEEVETRCKPGDIWQLGKHRLMCGDSTDPETINLLMDGKKADMIFTDPPYGVNLDTQFSTMHKANPFGPGGNDYAPVIGDDAPFNPDMFLSQFDYCKEQFWWGADYYRDKMPMGGSWIVWDKRDNDSDMNLDALLGSHFELCWSRHAHKREIARILWAGHHGMGKSGDTKSRVHPTQKPVGLVTWFFNRYGKDGDIVIDFYLGSGTTLIACERTGRVCYACELLPAYCDVVIARYEAETGQTATLLERVEVAAHV